MTKDRKVVDIAQARYDSIASTAPQLDGLLSNAGLSPMLSALLECVYAAASTGHDAEIIIPDANVSSFTLRKGKASTPESLFIYAALATGAEVRHQIGMRALFAKLFKGEGLFRLHENGGLAALADQYLNSIDPPRTRPTPLELDAAVTGYMLVGAILAHLIDLRATDAVREHMERHPTPLTLTAEQIINGAAPDMAAERMAETVITVAAYKGAAGAGDAKAMVDRLDTMGTLPAVLGL